MDFNYVEIGKKAVNLDYTKIKKIAVDLAKNKAMVSPLPKFFGLEKGTFTQTFKKGSNVIFDFIPKEHLIVFHGFACSSNKMSNLELRINKKFVKINSSELYKEGFIIKPKDRLFLSGVAIEEISCRVFPLSSFVLRCKEKSGV